MFTPWAVQYFSSKPPKWDIFEEEDVEAEGSLCHDGQRVQNSKFGTSVLEKVGPGGILWQSFNLAGAPLIPLT